ncbi:hypothetical protein Patl1_30444 [Pistacia atlantica]|uniref:Uncharacterized protein n=1 Tax=Pistacia atlantica TaxID=434234 RepID=A0ACC1A9B9_9ROSI|nr:hypothetical protein Patl1_30444 [Pistacia atlantica]
MLCSWKGCFAIEIVEIAVEVLKLLVVEVLKLLFVLNIEMVVEMTAKLVVEVLKLLVVEVLKVAVCAVLLNGESSIESRKVHSSVEAASSVVQGAA